MLTTKKNSSLNGLPESGGHEAVRRISPFRLNLHWRPVQLFAHHHCTTTNDDDDDSQHHVVTSPPPANRKAQETSNIDVSWPQVCFLFPHILLLMKFLDTNLTY
jgi:hypothetical protein